MLGTRADDFWRGYETFPIIFGGTNILRAILMGYKTILPETILDEVINQRLKKVTSGNDEPFDRYEIALDSLISVHISLFYAQRLLDGKPFCLQMVGYKELFLGPRSGMKSSLIVSNHPPPWHPGLKIAVP